ncbi:MAG: hypothetical protein EBU90_26650, partial [Proteobacteria bacterium]|nr:hypothetical protein [Pseudomonadota bacterium]
RDIQLINEAYIKPNCVIRFLIMQEHYKRTTAAEDFEILVGDIDLTEFNPPVVMAAAIYDSYKGVIKTPGFRNYGPTSRFLVNLNAGDDMALSQGINQLYYLLHYTKHKDKKGKAEAIISNYSNDNLAPISKQCICFSVDDGLGVAVFDDVNQKRAKKELNQELEGEDILGLKGIFNEL